MTNNKVYHVLKREMGDSTHYSELPIIFEGSYKECEKYLNDMAYKSVGYVYDCDIVKIYEIYGTHDDNETIEYLIA